MGRSRRIAGTKDCCSRLGGGETLHYGTDSQDRRGGLSAPDEDGRGIGIHCGRLSRPRAAVQIVAFDHTLQGRAIDVQDSRRGLLIATSMGQYPGDMARLNLQEGYQLTQRTVNPRSIVASCFQTAPGEVP